MTKEDDPTIVDFQEQKDRRRNRRETDKPAPPNLTPGDITPPAKKAKTLLQILGYSKPSSTLDLIGKTDIPEMNRAFEARRHILLAAFSQELYDNAAYYILMGLAVGVIFALLITAWTGQP